MGKGAIDDRSHLSLMAVGPPGARPRPDRLRPRGSRHLGRLRPRRVRAVPLEPGRLRSGSSTSTRSPPRSMPTTSPRSSSSATSAAPWSELLAATLPGGVGGRSATRAPRVARDARPRGPAHGPPRATCQRARSNAGYPITPQRAIYDLRRALGPDDIVVSDVGAHKIWVARLYQAYEPNTVIISNGFASMGIALPGAIAAKLVHPDRQVVALCGDGGFLMNVQELETAKRIGAADRRRHLARQRLRADRLEAAQRVRAPVRGRVRQPGLRRLRAVIRHPRLPADVGGRAVPDADAGAGRRRAGGDRRARSTTPRTSA